MPANIIFSRPTRIPVEVAGIQVNHCKNPSCCNFGVAPWQFVKRGRPALDALRDTYKLSNEGKDLPHLWCLVCSERPPIKSNLAVAEELERMLQDLRPRPEAHCPDTQCVNHSVPVSAGKAHYQSFGLTHSGSQRYRCKACRTTFSIAATATLRQREGHKNRMILSLLINKSPFRRICEVADIRPETLYQRIDFFYRQCKSFAATREGALLNGMPIERLYVAVDRQEYVVNWSHQDDKRNVILHAVGSADNRTGYVFGMHLDFDPTLDPVQVENDAAACGDQTILHAYRRYARLWLKSDYGDSIRQAGQQKRRLQRARRQGLSASAVTDDVAATYAEVESRPDVEAGVGQTIDTQLPAWGMQVHPEYTLYGHFFFLQRLFRGVGKVRFFLDQESGIRAACLAAFKEEIGARCADAFYVRINTLLTVNERRRAIADSRAEFEKHKQLYPGLKDREVELILIEERLQEMEAIGKWSDRWLLHPFPSMSEPEKAVCYLTNCQDYDPHHLARLYRMASLHAIDRFFMQLRRRLSLLERPITSASAGGRNWNGYSPYNPEVVVKLLLIFRIAYNYVFAGADKKTPAMRLGLAKGRLDLGDIINFYAR